MFALRTPQNAGTDEVLDLSVSGHAPRSIPLKDAPPLYNPFLLNMMHTEALAMSQLPHHHSLPFPSYIAEVGAPFLTGGQPPNHHMKSLNGSSHLDIAKSLNDSRSFDDHIQSLNGSHYVKSSVNGGQSFNYDKSLNGNQSLNYNNKSLIINESINDGSQYPTTTRGSDRSCNGTYSPSLSHSDSSMDDSCGHDETRQREADCSGKRADEKDSAYLERRRKNNLAAKRSRDAKRKREAQIKSRVIILEDENRKLREQLAACCCRSSVGKFYKDFFFAV